MVGPFDVAELEVAQNLGVFVGHQIQEHVLILFNLISWITFHLRLMLNLGILFPWFREKMSNFPALLRKKVNTI